MKKLLLLLPFLASTAFAGNICIPYSQMKSFTAHSSTALTIHTYNEGDFSMSVAPCFGLTTANKIAFDSWSSFEVCDRDHLLVMDPWGGVEDRCWITDINQK